MGEIIFMTELGNHHSSYKLFQELALYGEFTIRETLQYFGR